MTKQLAEAKESAATANRKLQESVYKEFTTRSALLEVRRRSKEITEAEFKAKLAELRNDLAQ